MPASVALSHIFWKACAIVALTSLQFSGLFACDYFLRFCATCLDDDLEGGNEAKDGRERE